MGYLRKYNDNILGMTGTVGGQASQRMMTHPDTYNLDIVKIPTHKETRFHEFLPIFVFGGKNAWLSRIARKARRIASVKVVLVICRHIEEVGEIKKLIPNQKRIYEYSRNDREEQSAIPERVFSVGDIIIATNLAGRGTDIHLRDPIRDVLHVILTFFPASERVEQQNFGRTARCGNVGSGQMILNRGEVGAEYDDALFPGIDWLRARRERKECAAFEDFFANSLPKRHLADKLFQRFCAHFQKLRNISRDSSDIVNRVSDIHKQRQVQELWGLKLLHLLKEDNDDDEELEEQIRRKRREMSRDERRAEDERVEKEAIEQLDQFIKDVTERFGDYGQLSLFENPCYLTRCGIQMSNWGKYEIAINYMKKAIKLDQRLSFGARYNLAVTMIRSNEGQQTSAQQQQENLRQALVELEEALKLIQEEMRTPWTVIKNWIGIQQQKQSDAQLADTQLARKPIDLQQQMDIKLEILNHISSYIKNAIDKVKEVRTSKPDHILRVVGSSRIGHIFINGYDNRFGQDVAEEIWEIEAFGVPVLFDLAVMKLENLFWKRLLLFFVGVVQVVIGLVFVYYKCTKIGKWFISQGIKDMLDAIFSNDLSKFTFEGWVTAKGVSLCVELAFFGLGAIASKLTCAAKPATEAVQNLALETMKGVVGKTICCEAAGYFMGKAIDKSVEWILKQFHPELRKHVFDSMERTIKYHANACKLIMCYNGFKWFLWTVENFLKQSKVVKFIKKVMKGLLEKMQSRSDRIITISIITSSQLKLVGQICEFLGEEIRMENAQIEKELRNKMQKMKDEHKEWNINIDEELQKMKKSSENDLINLAIDLSVPVFNAFILILEGTATELINIPFEWTMEKTADRIFDGAKKEARENEKGAKYSEDSGQKAGTSTADDKAGGKEPNCEHKQAGGGCGDCDNDWRQMGSSKKSTMPTTKMDR